jgi:CheY-like chemotaxis protein
MVDDDPAVAEMYRFRLELAGFEVTMASSGEEALEAACRLAPDAIVLDYQLPGLNGEEVLARLRRMEGCRDVPVLVLSNNDDPGTIHRLQALGAAGHCVKVNTTPTALVQRLEGLLV